MSGTFSEHGASGLKGTKDQSVRKLRVGLDLHDDLAPCLGCPLHGDRDVYSFRCPRISVVALDGVTGRPSA